MAITGLTAHDALGLTLFVPYGRQEAAAAFYICAFGATSPRHWIHPKTGEVAGIDIREEAKGTQAPASLRP